MDRDAVNGLVCVCATSKHARHTRISIVREEAKEDENENCRKD
jgi:hypothetical protein